jgi:hypothetical protein
LCNVGGTMENYNSCDFQDVEVNNCSAPGLGSDKELSGGTASLDANVTLKSGESIAWFKDGVLISGATGTTYTATETGTYKAVVTGEDCTKEDQILISEEGSGPVCSNPALGKDTTLIGGSAILNANITLQSGETISWFKDGAQIWGSSGTSYTATSVGTYKAVVTGTGCNAEDEIVIGAEVIVCSNPALGSDVTFNGTSALLDANITLKSGETIAWYKDGSIIWGVNTTTYTATSLGTYKVVVTRQGCSNEDEVEVALVTCSSPDLGEDVSLCSGKTVNLDSKVTLATGESIKWYKDGSEIAGETGTTYTASTVGSYKAEVSGPSNCTRVDSMNVTDGGSQHLQISASNNGKFCSVGNPSSVTLTVTGGAGTYNFYDDSTGQTPIITGASLVVDQNLVSDGSSKTFYVQEPSGPPVTIGETTPYTVGAWANLSTNQNWNNYRVVLNTLDKVTLESVDFVFYQNHATHTLVITVYDYGTENVVKTKTIQLDGSQLSYVSGSTFPLNKVQLDLELPQGNYEISFIGSTFTFHIVQSGVDYSDAKFSSQGIAEIKGVNQPGSWNYPTENPSHLGAYNWVFKSGAAGACGRASIDVTATCGPTTGVEELGANGIAVYPNPARDVINIDISGVDATNNLVELYNTVGQLVASQNGNTASGNIIQFGTADLEAGLYCVKVFSQGKVYTKRVVISK